MLSDRILKLYLTKPRQAPQPILDHYGKSINEKQADEIRGLPEDQLSMLKSDRRYVRAALDYVAGMTDRFALREYDQLFSAYPRAEM